MKKILLSASLVVSTLVAQDSWFAGIDLAHNNASGYEYRTVTAGVVGVEQSLTNDMALNIKVGQEGFESRQYLNYSVEYNKASFAYCSLGYSYDKFAEDINGVIPFYGVHLGVGKLKTSQYTDKGLEYGVQGGILKQIDDKSTFEAGVKYKVTTASASVVDVAVTTDSDINSMTSLYVGYNIRF